MRLIKKNWYSTVVLVILIVSSILRFVNYEHRWGLAYDQAHDALVARHAIETFQLPLLGPFSSAGPYQTGGEWYWIVMIGTIFYPFSIITPWMFMTVLYVLFVFFIINVGNELVDKRFGVIVGFLAAVSPAQITQGTNLTNQSPMALVGLLSIWCSIRYLRSNQRKYLFFLALAVGFGASIHLQGAALGVLLIITFIVGRQFDIKTLLCLPLGLLIPWIPVLVVDLQNNFFNTGNMLHYYLHDQYKISLDVLGRRWKTYAGIFVPNVWSFVIGGHVTIGYVTLLSMLGIVGYECTKRKLTKEWFVLLVSILGMFTILRYTRTPLFESYFVFMHAFILLLTAWIVYWLYQQRVLFGYLVLVIFLFFSLHRDIKEINSSSNLTAGMVNTWKNYLAQHYPGRSFSIYDKENALKDRTFPLVLFIHNNRQYNATMKIGLVATESAYIKYPILYGHKDGIKLVDLNSLSNQQLEKEHWYLINARLVYYSTELWYKNK